MVARRGSSSARLCSGGNTLPRPPRSARRHRVVWTCYGWLKTETSTTGGTTPSDGARGITNVLPPLALPRSGSPVGDGIGSHPLSLVPQAPGTRGNRVVLLTTVAMMRWPVKRATESAVRSLHAARPHPTPGRSRLVCLHSACNTRATEVDLERADQRRCRGDDRFRQGRRCRGCRPRSPRDSLKGAAK